jgi:hypothetical protein
VIIIDLEVLFSEPLRCSSFDRLLLLFHLLCPVLVLPQLLQLSVPIISVDLHILDLLSLVGGVLHKLLLLFFPLEIVAFSIFLLPVFLALQGLEETSVL